MQVFWQRHVLDFLHGPERPQKLTFRCGSGVVVCAYNALNLRSMHLMGASQYKDVQQDLLLCAPYVSHICAVNVVLGASSVRFLVLREPFREDDPCQLIAQSGEPPWTSSQNAFAGDHCPSRRDGKHVRAITAWACFSTMESARIPYPYRCTCLARATMVPCVRLSW